MIVQFLDRERSDDLDDRTLRNLTVARSLMTTPVPWIPVILACCLAVQQSRAGPNYTLDHITRENGLPQSSVRAVAQDKAGFLWIGTEAGLSRYDGYEFRNYKPPFGHGVVNTIDIDSRGRIWTAWYDKQVTLYDSALDTWQVLEAKPPRGFRLGITESPDGRVWLSDGAGIYYYDESLREAVKVLDVRFNVTADHWQSLLWHDGLMWVNALGRLTGFDINSGTVVSAINHDSGWGRRLWEQDNSLWLCNQGSVYRLDVSLRLTTVFADPSYRIQDCRHAADGSLWIATKSTGAIRIGPDGQRQDFVHDPDDASSLASNDVITVSEDRLGQMWIVNKGVVNLYADGKIKRFRHSPSSVNGFLGGNAVSHLLEDRSGVIWLGSEGAGLARISRYANKFRFLKPPGTLDPHVRQPVMDAAGNLWVGMNQDGVYRWNRSENTWTHFAADPGEESRLPTHEIRAMLVSAAGNIWAGGKAPVLNRFVPKDGSWRRLDLGGGHSVSALLQLPEGQILIGSEGALSVLDPRAETVRQYPLAGIGHIRAMALSRTGNVYVGTHQGPGVIEFVPTRGFARAWFSELSETNIFSLYEDRFGFLWIGTWGGGLNRLNPETNEVQVISTADGLPDNTIFGILPGGHDELWMSTYAGLARIKNCITQVWPCKPLIKSFDESQGLVQTEFDAEAHLRAPTGELFFGGEAGLTYFDPGDIEENPVPPSLRFTDVRLNGRSVLSTKLSAEPVSLLLESAFGTLELAFSALDFHRPEYNRYQYRLHPDLEWVPLGANPGLALNNLGTGRYSLEIRGSNNDGIWSEKPLRMPIRVRPPVYLSWPALSAYALLLLLSSYVIIRMKEKRTRHSKALLEQTVRERTEELDRAYKARNEFFANVSHEIRTPLTLLLGSVEQLEENQSVEHKPIAAIKRHAKDLHRYVDSLITISHLSSSSRIEWYAEDIVQYLAALLADLEAVAGRKSLLLTAKPIDHLLVRSYPHALNAIFWNILINALQHTPEGGQISVSIASDEAQVTILISDSGPGVDRDALDSIFDRGVRGQGPAAGTHGFGIGLSLVRQTVRALGGRVAVRNIATGGACFEVILEIADASLPIVSYERNWDAGALYQTAAIAGNSSTASTHKKGNPLVLIVEDHQELRQSVCRLLQGDYNMLEAPTAAAALTLVRNEVPDVVICDVMLPDKDGFTVLADIRTSIATDHIAVIMLTALADEASRMRGLAHRADAYLTKPFQSVILKMTVENLLLERRTMMRYAGMQVWCANTAVPGTTGNIDQRFEYRFMSALESVYDDSNCGIEDLAGLISISRRQLERKTRVFFDKSPNVLLNEFRLHKAAEQLRAGRGILDVAMRCGFGSQSRFGAVFKERFACTPSEYASSQRDDSG